MKSIVKVLLTGIFLIISYYYLKPIAFLLIAGIILCILFISYLISIRKLKQKSEESYFRQLSLLSTVIFIFLFVLSLFVLKSYQLPSGNTPYFRNSDHIVVSNYGMAFDGRLELFSTDKSKSLWPSEHGSLSFNPDQNDKASVELNEFNLPVFKTSQQKGYKFNIPISIFKKAEERVILLNPVYRENITPGFVFRDRETSLEWTSINYKIRKEAPVFEMTLIFKSTDSILLNNFYNKGEVYSDTLKIDSLTLKKGLSLKSIIANAKSSKLGLNLEITKQWVGRFSELQLLTVYSDSSKSYNLSLFHGNHHDGESWAEVRGEKLRPVNYYKISADSADYFHVGLGNSKQQFRFRKQMQAEREFSEERNYVFEFKSFNIIPLSTGLFNKEKAGSVEVYFMKNSYTQLGVDEIRKGFLFNETINDNGFTRFNGLFEFVADRTGTPLNYKIQSLGTSENVSQKKNNFSLKSDNGNLLWLFKLSDLSKNPFSYLNIVCYLSILTFLIVLLVIVTPGRGIVYIETPILIVIYLFYVFRLLLLWRVATFPPFENITLKEFQDLRFFDIFSIGGIQFPKSLLIFSVALVIVIFLRLYSKGEMIILEKLKGSLKKVFERILRIFERGLNFFDRIKLWVDLRNEVLCRADIRILLYLCLILVLGILLSKILWPRIFGIIYPLVAYVYFSHRLFLIDEQKAKNLKLINERNKNYLNQLSVALLDDTSFWAATFTLFSLLITDRGFAIIFLFFLLFKSIIFNFSYARQERQTLNNLFFHPDGKWIFSLSSVIILSILLLNKGVFDFILRNKFFFLQVLLVFFSLLLYYKFYKYSINHYIKKKLFYFPLLLSLVFFLPQIKHSIDSKFNNSIKHVVYRTSILYRPVEDMLFDYEYDSFNERKIIETAQGQWFINSYLNPQKTSIIGKEMINFRPHFNKGASYLTQTRDLVLPRYVISEFGGLVMVLLICLLLLPVIIYFLFYKLVYKKSLHHQTGTGAIILLLLFTSGFTVWLTSTNRFVFFGQDFAFISLASLMSSLIPLILVSSLLMLKPRERFEPSKPYSLNWFGWTLGIIFIAFWLFLSGRSKLIRDEKFKINFSDVETRISSQINSILQEIQRSHPVEYPINNRTIQYKSDALIGNVKQLLELLFKDKRFQVVYQNSSKYEKSILEKLRLNPGMGFELSNPVHLRYNDDLLSISFNKYFRIELPAYELENEWKGDIRQEELIVSPEKQKPEFSETIYGNATVVVIPSSYFPPGTGKRGLLNLYTNDPERFTISYIYDGVEKDITETSPSSYVEILDSSDIVFMTAPNGSHLLNYTINEYNRPYFAYSFEINGKQKHIFPLGNSFYWIKHWTEANQKHFKSNNLLEANTSITLDYKLTDSVNSYLQASLKQFKKELPRLSFSVAAADGTGKVRLLADFEMRRDIIDPNDAQRILEKQKDQYFIIDNENERIQWGNVNFLRMKQGPGSSIKPVILAASSSQLRLEWEQLKYLNSGIFPLEKQNLIIGHYAGLRLGNKGWKVLQSSSPEVDILRYIKKSDNLYHSLLIFLSSYQKDDFGNQHSFTNILKSSPADSLSNFPKINLGGMSYYLPGIKEWPATYKTNRLNDTKIYFGNPKSLLALGMDVNFGMKVQSPSKYGLINQKTNISTFISESLKDTFIWSFPEESFFLQFDRTAQNLQENFVKGLRNTTLGGSPFQTTPLKMLEAYGKLATLNNQYRVRIDGGKLDTLKDWNYDKESWGTEENFTNFITNHVYRGMKEVMTVGGTGAPLLNSLHEYKGYYFYGKTGTIDGTTKNDNSKRLAIIISNKPLGSAPSNLKNKSYMVFFTVGDAFKTDDVGEEKNWFWIYYRNIIDFILESESFKNYMEN